MEPKDFSRGILVGLVAGALTGIIFAPKSGKELRKDAQDTFQKMKEELAQKIGQIQELSEENYNQAVGRVISGYREAQKITPEQAEEIEKILAESFTKIEKSLKKNVEKVKKASKESEE